MMRSRQSNIFPVALGLIAIGLFSFIWPLLRGRPEIAWQAYLVNFLLFSAIAQGAVVFSAMMNTVRAVWSRRLANLAEAFAAFFPLSLLLFLGLFWGREYVFPWLHHDLHGKEIWLNLPFLFSRNLVGLLILYGLGFAYLYYSLWFKVGSNSSASALRTRLARLWHRAGPDTAKYEHRRYVFGVLYLLAFAVVLSLVGYDLVMAAEPHWYSTLFGAYTFIKAIYVGFGALIILAAYLHLNHKEAFRLDSAEFLDMGRLFFAFCLAWADFFYCQLVVIWYGNISEETAYVITRTLMAPWNRIAWAVFIICFILPFLLLLNRRIKTVPRAMMILCSLVLVGMWLEHYLLLGPALSGHTAGFPVAPVEVGVGLGFLGLMMAAVFSYLHQFPEMLESGGNASE